tara:strand:+ start:3597 stop:4874 length:1278 start_codon:yes stop_codon:yes gene_type:complete
MALENIPSITGDVVEADPNLMPIYQVQSQDPGLATGQLQKLYGTAAMPMFQWAKRIQTGEATFDPANQFDREAADFIASASDADLESQGVDSSVKDALVQAGGFAAQAVVSKAGLQAATKAGLTGFGNAPVSSGQFTSQLMPAAKSYLPEFAGGPASYVNPDLAIPAGLTPDQSLVTSQVFKTLQGAKPDLMGHAVPGNSGFMKVGTGQFNEAVSLAGDTSIVASASAAPDPGMFETGGFFEKGTTGYTPSLGQMGLNFGIGLGVNLLMGASPKEAAKQAAISTVGTTLGTIAFGPVGGFIGGTVASIIGGRVICNELVRQGFMNRNQIILDYRFTREHLSPQHVKGYHAWAIHIVRRLRKGKGVKMWRHIATHRVNEIAYIYGERDKPDYLGKIYRHVGEKGCWLVGLFCEKSDWSVLYKTKEA